MTATYSVRDYLDADLAPSRSVRHLQELAVAVADQPLHTTVDQVRVIVATTSIGIEDYRRLHILISHLCQAGGADLALLTQLRADVNHALAEGSHGRR